MINGVLCRARTGVPWPELPERYGPQQTLYEQHRRWSAGRTWQQILAELQIDADATDPDGQLARHVREDSAQRTQARAVNIDSTSCRAHQHAAGARLRGRKPHPWPVTCRLSQMASDHRMGVSEWWIVLLRLPYLAVSSEFAFIRLL